MGMADEARQATNRNAAEQREFLEARRQWQKQWREDVGSCAAEFAQAAGELGLKTNGKGLLRKRSWSVLVPLEQPEPMDHRSTVWVFVDSSGAWKLSDSTALDDRPRDKYSHYLADYESIRKAFLRRLQER